MLFLPAVFAHIESSHSGPLFHCPHLQDSSARSIYDQKESMAFRKGGRLVIASFLLNLQPTQLSISVSCNSITETPAIINRAPLKFTGCVTICFPLSKHPYLLPHSTSHDILLTFPHANANASSQVQQGDPSKIVSHTR